MVTVQLIPLLQHIRSISMLLVGTLLSRYIHHFLVDIFRALSVLSPAALATCFPPTLLHQPSRSFGTL